MNELERLQRDTQEMLDDISVYAGVMYVLAGAGAIGLLIWAVRVVYLK